MKKTVLMLILLMVCIHANAQGGAVQVSVLEVVAEWGGSVRVGLYHEDNFPVEGKAIHSKIIPVRDIQAVAHFDNIPAGEYAIAVYQDINEDELLNRNIYRQPTEPYGFSNNVFGRFGPPKFTSVSFQVEKDVRSELEIRLKE